MASKKGGLEALLAARRLGVRQTDGMEQRLASGPMFEEVTDEQYRKTVEERRAQGRFVVGKSAWRPRRACARTHARKALPSGCSGLIFPPPRASHPPAPPLPSLQTPWATTTTARTGSATTTPSTAGTSPPRPRAPLLLLLLPPPPLRPRQ